MNQFIEKAALQETGKLTLPSANILTQQAPPVLRNTPAAPYELDSILQKSCANVPKTDTSLHESGWSTSGIFVAFRRSPPVFHQHPRLSQTSSVAFSYFLEQFPTVDGSLRTFACVSVSLSSRLEIQTTESG